MYLGDDLFAYRAWSRRSSDSGDDFIFTCKETSNKALYDFIDGGEFERHEVEVRKGRTRETHRYRFVEKVALRDGKDAVRVNWIGFEISDAKGDVEYKTALVASLPITKANVADIVACSRARWKIENESFNVLKNHGSELEHNFGHGEKYLAMTLAALNMLAFAWHRFSTFWSRLATGERSGGKANEFLRLCRNLDELRRLPRLVRLLEALATFTVPPPSSQRQKTE